MKLTRASIHESSHAILALAGRLPVLFLACDSNEGVMHLESVTSNQMKDSKFRRVYSTAIVAGAVGESLLFKENALSSLTSGFGYGDCTKLANNGFNATDIVKACDDAEKYLRRHWHVVNRLATALDVKKFLLDDEVHRICGELPLLFDDPNPNPNKVEAKPKKTSFAFLEKAYEAGVFSSSNQLAMVR